MQQVAVRAVELDHLEPRAFGAARGIDEGLPDPLQLGQGQRVGLQPIRPDRVVSRGHNVPGAVAARPVGFVQGAVAEPGTLHARLAAGVGELHRRDRSLRLDEGCNALERRDMRVAPDPEVAMRDAPGGLDRGGFGEDQPGTADGELGEVREVPVAGHAVGGRVLAHRRDRHAVRDSDAAQVQRGEQQGMRHGG